MRRENNLKFETKKMKMDGGGDNASEIGADKPSFLASLEEIRS